MPVVGSLDNLVNGMADDFLSSFKVGSNAQETDLSVRPGVGAHAPEILAALGIFLDPYKGGGFVCKPPRLHDLDGLRDIGERGPHEASCSICGGDVRERQVADILNRHSGIVLLCCTPALV